MVQTDCLRCQHTILMNKATQAGLVSHYSQIADSTVSPLIQRTGTYRLQRASGAYGRALRQRKCRDSRKLQEIWHRLQRQCI